MEGNDDPISVELLRGATGFSSATWSEHTTNGPTGAHAAGGQRSLRREAQGHGHYCA